MSYWQPRISLVLLVTPQIARNGHERQSQYY